MNIKENRIYEYKRVNGWVWKKQKWEEGGGGYLAE